MRTRSVALVALVALPALVGAQVRRQPPMGRGTPPKAAPLPPEAPVVARALAYKRSRWLLEGYSMISTFQLSSVDGGATSFTGFGGGTRGGYRINDYVSGTVDGSLVAGGMVSAATAEVGTRFSFMPRDQQLRPYLDVRGAFIQMRDAYATSNNGLGSTGLFQDYTQGGRYSRGFGSVVGSGFEYQLRPSFAVATGMSVMRARMNSYRFTGAAQVPSQSNYWMTSYRYVLGIKYNPTRLLNVLAQNVTNK
jgi:hypothetical protein